MIEATYIKSKYGKARGRNGLSNIQYEFKFIDVQKYWIVRTKNFSELLEEIEHLRIRVNSLDNTINKLKFRKDK